MDRITNRLLLGLVFAAAASVLALLILPATAMAATTSKPIVGLSANGPSLPFTSLVMDRNYDTYKEVEIENLEPYDEIDVASTDSSIVDAWARGGTIVISAYKKGSATLTVTVSRYVYSPIEGEDGYWGDYVQVAALKLNVRVTELKFSASKSVYDSLVMYKGEYAQIKVAGSDSGAKLSFVSKDKRVATVTSSGKVRAKGFGQGAIDVKVGNMTISYSVAVGSKKGVKAVRWALKYAGKAKYSQPKRMSKGYFDCSSLTGRSYASQGMTLGGLKSWSSTAAGQAYWCKTNGHVVFDANKDLDLSQLRPGDLLFYRTGYAGVNPEYRHIDHVAIYAGNGYKVEVSYGAVPEWGSAIMVGRPTQYATPVPVSAGIAAKKASASAVKISWKKRAGVTGYKVFRAVDDPSADYKLVATVTGASKTSYVNKKLASGHTYYYKVRAYKKAKGSIFLGKFQANKYGEPVTKSVKL